MKVPAKPRRPFLNHDIYQEAFPELRFKTKGSYNLFCPFHPDSGTRSFSVNLDKGVFFCHGGCTQPKGGNHITFLMKRFNIPRAEALRRVIQLERDEMFNREHLQVKKEFETFLYWARREYTAQRRRLVHDIEDMTGGYTDCIAGEWLNWTKLTRLYHQLSQVDYVLETLDELRDIEQRDTKRSAAEVSSIKKIAHDVYQFHRQAGDWTTLTDDLECKIQSGEIADQLAQVLGKLYRDARDAHKEPECSTTKNQTSSNPTSDPPPTTIPRTPV